MMRKGLLLLKALIIDDNIIIPEIVGLRYNDPFFPAAIFKSDGIALY